MNKKVAIVTGASSGLGRAIALHLNQYGWSVVLHGRDPVRLRVTIDAMHAPENAVYVAGELNTEVQRDAILDAALSHFGRVDALVNNAGIFSPRPFLEVTEEYLDSFLSTNFKGTYFLTQKVLPVMIEQQQGSIVNVGSVLVDHVIGGVPTTAAISVKGAIHSFSRQLAAEVAKHHIRVNTLAPGIIRSPMHMANGVEDDSLAGLHLLDRIGETEHIASMTRELLENSFITGTTINVDGGHVAGHHLS